MTTQRQWGLTAPISTNFPTEKELALNEALIAELKAQDTFEAPEETKKRFALVPSLFPMDRRLTLFQRGCSGDAAKGHHRIRQVRRQTTRTSQ